VSNERVAVPDQAPPGPGLSPSSRRAALALAEALFSTHDGPPPPDRLAWLGDELDDFFGHAGLRSRLSFLLCLESVTRLVPLVRRRPVSFTSLTVQERIEALEQLERTPLALPFFGAKTILCMMYYEHPDAAREAGVDNNCLRGQP
jgi:hypothetical protein